MLRIHLVAAARPNFMKVAPLYRELQAAPWSKAVLVHTGQHYDNDMSGSFIRAFKLPNPDYNLEVGSGSHAEQTAGVMRAYDKLLDADWPDLCVVVGDVNSTIACALTGVKRGVRVAHLEAGLRSRDRAMPEEINRILTDAISDLLWAPSQDGVDNLLAEGIPSGKIELVGNIMIDALEMRLPEIRERHYSRTYSLAPEQFAVATLHRPSNVDSPEQLKTILVALKEVAKRIPIVFPVHPRTRRTLALLESGGFTVSTESLILTDPLPYLEFMSLVFECRLAITDSGGIQEETSYLGVPCFTLRNTTERPITTSLGTNRLTSPAELTREVDASLTRPSREAVSIPLWDGKTASRVVKSIAQRFL